MHIFYVHILLPPPPPIIIIHSSIVYFWTSQKRRKRETVKNMNQSMEVYGRSKILIWNMFHITTYYACLPHNASQKKKFFTTFGESHSTFIRTHTLAIKIINHLIRGIHKKWINLLLHSQHFPFLSFDSKKWSEKRFYDDENAMHCKHTPHEKTTIRWWSQKVYKISKMMCICPNGDWHFNNQHYIALYSSHLISIWSHHHPRCAAKRIWRIFFTVFTHSFILS